MDGIDQLANATDAYVPIVWFDDGLEELDDKETIELLKSAVVQPAQIQAILFPVLLAAGITTILVTLLILAVTLSKKNKVETETSFHLQQHRMANPKL